MTAIEASIRVWADVGSMRPGRDGVDSRPNIFGFFPLLWLLAELLEAARSQFYDFYAGIADFLSVLDMERSLAMFMCKNCGKKDVPRRGKRTSCKECETAYLREWKKNSPEKQKKYNKKSNSSDRVKLLKQNNRQVRQARRRHIKTLCVEYLGGVCQKQPFCFYPLKNEQPICYAAFDFHHREPDEKVAGIALIINTRLKDSIIRRIQLVDDLVYAPELIEELDKCDLLCANCHHRLEYCDGCKRNLTT